MSDALFRLFDEELSSRRSLVASDPQNIESLSGLQEEQEFLIGRAADVIEPKLKVDYSDFANFVHFNSALDYFNITGTAILNDYPYDGSINDVRAFVESLDQYQRYALSVWPSRTGHLRFDTSVSSSWIQVDDVGLDTEGGAYRVGLMSPGTSSLSIELWMESSAALTGTEEVQVLVQKLSGSDGFSLYLTGSEVVFSVVSASAETSVSAPVSFGTKQYVSAVMDRSAFTGSVYIMTGSAAEFPVIVSSSSLSIHGSVDIPGTPLTVASGTVSGKTTSFFTGSLDHLSLWKKPLSLGEVSGSFNAKSFKQTNLIALYRFNEPNGSLVEAENAIVIDSSGKKLDGTIQNYYPEIRGSGSLILGEKPDPVLNINDADVSSHVLEQQNSGSDYDRSNSHKITDLLPESYFTFSQEVETGILKNFLYSCARSFDHIKSHIDQFTNILTVKYGQFDQAPDELLGVVAEFFGWKFTGNFLNADVFQFLLGRNVLSNLESNTEIDKKLFQIKNEFWKRVLLNLPHIYKTKGTRESVKSLLRAYGVDNRFVRVKEFGLNSDVGISTSRISAQKSEPALGFASGTLTGSIVKRFDSSTTGSFSIEGQFMFPLTSSANIQPTSLSGTMMGVGIGTSGALLLSYTKDALASSTGTLSLSSSDGLVLQLEDVGIFNGKWHHVTAVQDQLSSSLSLQVRGLNSTEIASHHTSSVVLSGGLTVHDQRVSFGIGGDLANALLPPNTFDSPAASEYWAHELRFWDKALNAGELDDHTLNFQSYGVSDVVSRLDGLRVHWRLDENVTGSNISIVNVSANSIDGTTEVSGFAAGVNPYRRFLFDYSYIASPDFGWNEDKVRTYDTVELKPKDSITDSNFVSLEFNMIDALNEDIVQIMSSLDEMNEMIGYPGNKHRVHYDDLSVRRHQYFKRLQGRLNFNTFARMLDFFDRSFVDMVRKLVPARSNFMGDEFIVESHMLERPKITYERRLGQEIEFAPEGLIEMWTRFGNNEDKSGRTFPVYLTGSA